MNEWWLHGAFALGGGLGAVARFALTTTLTHRYPLSTLLVNILGCFTLGFLLTLVLEMPDVLAVEQERVFIGFCGGFTTFSSFAYQSLDLHRKHSLVHATINVLVSVLLCVGAFLAGRVIGHGVA